MNIDYPAQNQEESLRSLWKSAFGDDDDFLEQFYTVGFASDRCRCVTQDGKLVAALYWFDCSCDGKPFAYLYGIATDKHHRGKGLCRMLMENTHSHLKYLGYVGTILVPAHAPLFALYEKLGYRTFSYMTEFTVTAAPTPATIREVDGEEFCRLRREYLPDAGVLQEGDALGFLQKTARFYAGEDFLVTVNREEPFFVPELLGNAQAAPEILTALHQNKGRFRTPGEEMPFAMYHPLSDAPAPAYFGLAFD